MSQPEEVTRRGDWVIIDSQGPSKCICKRCGDNIDYPMLEREKLIRLLNQFYQIHVMCKVADDLN